MATATSTAPPIPPLLDGDRLTMAEFERRYAAAPQIKKAELIEGVARVVPSVTDDHGVSHSRVHIWIGFYDTMTPHVTSSIDGSTRLDAHNLFQPDTHLRIDAGHGGRSMLSPDRRVEGPPELVVEVAVTSVHRDLVEKFAVYRRVGVREYLVWRVADRAIDWFALRGDRYERLQPGADGLLRSETFPGLWLDPTALIAGDMRQVAAAVQRGLASPEHAAFVARLGRVDRPEPPLP